MQGWVTGLFPSPVAGFKGGLAGFGYSPNSKVGPKLF